MREFNRRSAFAVEVEICSTRTGKCFRGFEITWSAGQKAGSVPANSKPAYHQKTEKPHVANTVMENPSDNDGRCRDGWSRTASRKSISAWKASRKESPDRIRVVDLDQVTSIDKDGEEVLRMMIQGRSRVRRKRSLYKAPTGCNAGTPHNAE